MDPFIGEIRLFAGTYAPTGWNFCDGTLLQLSQYDALYALLGTTYGGDGRATFALPDLRGRVPVHQGAGPGLSNYTMGQTGGVEMVTLTSANMPPHTHALFVSTAAGTANVPTGNVLAQAPSGSNVYRETTGTVAFSASQIIPTGGSQPHENRQPFQAMNYIIALEGIWPSQG